MKVANITEDGRTGGPQVWISNVAPALKEYEVDSLVICPKRDSEHFVARLDEGEVAYERMTLHRLSRAPSDLFSYGVCLPSEVLKLASLLRAKQVDLVHCNGSWQIKGLIAAKLVGKKAIWHLHETSVPWPIRAAFPMIHSLLVDGIIAASRATAEYYLDSAPINVPYRVIDSPVPTSYFDPDNCPTDESILAHPGLKVVTVASINPLKGLEDFIRMAHRIAATTERQVSFFIVGPVYENQQDYASFLKQLSDEGPGNIHFLGMRTDVRPVLSAADIYVCSSVSESSPISVWEAMAMGKPVVATDVGDVRLHIESAGCGYVVPVGSPGSLARKVTSILRNTTQLRNFSKSARSYARKYLDVHQCAKKQAEFYHSIAAL